MYVNPVTMGNAGWDLYVKDTKDRLKRGEIIHNLVRLILLGSEIERSRVLARTTL